MSLKPGKLQDDHTLTPGSMAEKIEKALDELVPPGANEERLGRRKLALAIARGVITHLVDNADAFHTTVRNKTGTGQHEQSPTIEVDLEGWLLP
jgi:hypothetical protein